MGVPHAVLAGGEWAAEPGEPRRWWPSGCAVCQSFFSVYVCMCVYTYVSLCAGAHLEEAKG